MADSTFSVDATDRRPRSGRRALVLGGGGSAGNAWLIGVIAGLFDAGIDVTDSELIVGTSAGSTAAAQITGASPARLFADIVSVPSQRGPAPVGTAGVRPLVGEVPTHLERTSRIIEASADAADMRRRMGAAAIEQATGTDGSARWRATVASRLPSLSWPEQEVLISAVDADSGDPVIFDRRSGVDLVDAVAASCSSVAAYSIGGARYLDGGYRSNAENADLAAGSERVLVLSPFGGRTRLPREWRLDLATQIDELRAGGSTVETIFPDEQSRAAFGDNMMDLSTRPPAARAGFQQGRAVAAELADFWS